MKPWSLNANCLAEKISLQISNYNSFGLITDSVALFANVPVRGERNSGLTKEFFAFGPREKWGKSKKAKRPPSTILLSPHFPLRGKNFVRVVQERLLPPVAT